MSDSEEYDFEYLGEIEDPVGEDAPAYFDKDGHALVGKTFFNPREKPNLMSGTSVKFTVKVPPFFDGKKSWFTYEDEILDWQEITEIPPEKRGLWAKQRLIDDAEYWKPLLLNSELKKPDGLNYLINKLRGNYVKGAVSVFLWRFLGFVTQQRPRGMEVVQWIPRVQVKKMRLIDSWVACAPVQEDKTDSEYLAWLDEENERRDDEARAFRAANPAPQAPQGGVFSGMGASAQPPPSRPELPDTMKTLDATDPKALEFYNTKLREDQRMKFPLSENMLALLFMVSAELNETMRERLVSTLLQKDTRIEDYDTTTIEGIFRDLYASVNTGFADPFVNRKKDKRQRSYILLDHGEWLGELGYWVQDEEDLREGFFGTESQSFWGYDDEKDAWFQRRGGRLKKGKYTPRKGKGKRKGKSNRGHFESHTKGKRPKGKGKGFY